MILESLFHYSKKIINQTGVLQTKNLILYSFPLLIYKKLIILNTFFFNFYKNGRQNILFNLKKIIVVFLENLTNNVLKFNIYSSFQ